MAKTGKEERAAKKAERAAKKAEKNASKNGSTEELTKAVDDLSLGTNRVASGVLTSQKDSRDIKVRKARSCQSSITLC